MVEARACLQAVTVSEELGFPHVMAKEGKRWAEPRVWIKESPPMTESTTEKDRRSLNNV
ncbi:hypothetical protein Gorai_008033 [Gossypium raimondii]|uniref:Uncharacterized protein n=1 Tax=Gossypium raimondii TaxID=29730 RepID=A0A7J8Q9R0_GOSRA|nr:hypothetical protein [Gossypium raimondii]